MIHRILAVLVTGTVLVNLLLWALSYWHPILEWIDPTEGVTFGLHGGVMMVEHTQYIGRSRGTRHQWIWGGFSGMETHWVPPWFMRTGIMDRQGFTLYFPMNLCAVILFPITVYLLLPVHYRRRRRRLGLCEICGYDLKATSHTCPECGHTTETAR